MLNSPSAPYSFAKIFGGVIAFVLLALYASIMGWMIWEVVMVGRSGEGEANSLGSGAITVVTAIGGLISALVISKLALTTPGTTPTLGEGALSVAEFDKDENAAKASPTLAAKSMAVLYLSVWVTVGLAALVVGTVLFPDLNSTVDDTGTSWLGLAIAAGYAYFGLDPKK